MATELLDVSGPTRGAVVLDEDEWTEVLEHIIERDYFPDIPKMQNKLEWLQAVRSRDPELLRQAQLNIAQRRAGIKTPVGASPATFATPGGLSSFRAPASLLRTPGAAQTPRLGAELAAAGREEPPEAGMSATAAAVQGMSLDGFMARHTSEDNASFAEIIERSNKRRRHIQPWLFEDPNPRMLEGTAIRPENGIYFAGAPENKLLTWPYVNKNALYYDSSEQAPVALTDAERAQQVQGAPKAINRSGTRLASASVPGSSGAETPSSSESESGTAHAAGAPGGEYSVLATPSFTPGVEESPFMTWGDLEGTPLRLDPSDDIAVDPGAAQGPHFHVPQASARDNLGRHMGATAASKLRQRAASARRAAPPLTPGAMPPPSTAPRGGARTPAASGATPVALSEAGRKLARSLHGGASPSAAVVELRASYRGGSAPKQAAEPATPSGRRTPSVTPARTPLPARPALQQRTAAGPAAGVAPRPLGSGSVTDDLLNI